MILRGKLRKNGREMLPKRQQSRQFWSVLLTKPSPQGPSSPRTWMQITSNPRHTLKCTKINKFKIEKQNKKSTSNQILPKQTKTNAADQKSIRETKELTCEANWGKPPTIPWTIRLQRTPQTRERERAVRSLLPGFELWGTFVSALAVDYSIRAEIWRCTQ